MLESKELFVKPPVKPTEIPDWYKSLGEPKVQLGKSLYEYITQTFAATADGERCVAKVNITKGRDWVQEEFDITTTLNQAAKRHAQETGESSQYFPLTRLISLEDGRKALLIEWLPDDLGLYDYLQKIRETYPDRFERAFLEALKQANEMAIILGKCGVGMADRKTSDFLWKDSQLKVRDWNAQGTMTVSAGDKIEYTDNSYQIQKAFFEIAQPTGLPPGRDEVERVAALANAPNLSQGTKLLLTSLFQPFFREAQQMSLLGIRERISQLISYTRMKDRQKENQVKRLTKQNNRDEAYVVADMISDPKRRDKLIISLDQKGRYQSPLERLILETRQTQAEKKQKEAERRENLSPREKEMEDLVREHKITLEGLRNNPLFRFPLPEKVLRLSNILTTEPEVRVFVHPAHYFAIGQTQICEAMCDVVRDWELLPQEGRAYIRIFREISHFLDFALDNRLFDSVGYERRSKFGEVRPRLTELLEFAAFGLLEERGYAQITEILEEYGIRDAAEKLSPDSPERERWERFRKGLELCGRYGVSSSVSFPQEPGENFGTPEWEISVLQDTLRSIDDRTHPLSKYPTLLGEMRANCSARFRELVLKTSPISFR